MHGEPPDPSGWVRVGARLGVLRAALYLLVGVALLVPLVLFDFGLALGIAYLIVALIAWTFVGRALAASSSRRRP